MPEIVEIKDEGAKTMSLQAVQRLLIAACATIAVLIAILIAVLIYFLWPASATSQSCAPLCNNAPVGRPSGNNSEYFVSLEYTDDGVPIVLGTQPESYTLEQLMLPQELVPHQYWITIQSYLEVDKANMTFAGSVTILTQCTTSTNIVQLHAKYLVDITPENVKIVNVNNTRDRIGVTEVLLNQPVDKMKILTSKPLRKGFWYQIWIKHYRSMLQINGKGLYLSSYVTEFQERRFLAATQFEVANARMVFPCFDEPIYKANFTITIRRRKEFRSLSNMPRKGFKEIDADWVEDYYATSIKMSTYLVALTISDFKYKEDTSRDGVLVRAYARPGSVDEGIFALNMTVRLLSYFSDYFDIPYALSKLDLIALPDFSHGAMENWGLVTFRETTMLYNETRDARYRKQNVAVIVAHELAHQWFGNLVTMSWWTDLWLNEGFAHYMAFVAVDAVGGEEDMETDFIYENVLLARRLDSLNTTHPVVSEVYDPVEILQLFDIITYRKGSCLLRMVRNFMGDNAFRRGLQIYLRRYAYKNAVSKDLWEAIHEAAVEDGVASARMGTHTAAEIMDNWVSQAGYPYVHIDRDYNTGRIAATQQKFVLDAKERAESKQRWLIPLSYLGASFPTWDSPSFVWLSNNTEDTEVVLPINLRRDEWVLANVNYNGFYRVQYDDHNWNLLMDQLDRDHLVLPTVERAKILDDSFEMSRADLLDLITALNATRYLQHETEFLPWVVALNNFVFVDRQLQSTAHYDLFLRYMKMQLTPTYHRLGWHQGADERKHDLYLRNNFISQACYYGVPDCTEKTTALYQEAIRINNINSIPVTFKQAVICTAIREGGSREWEFAWDKYLQATSASEKKLLLQTLACTRVPWLLHRLFHASLNHTLIRQWDLGDIVTSVTTNPVGRAVAWRFLKENWDLLMERLDEISGKLVDVLNYFNTEWELQDVDLFMSRTDLSNVQRKFLEARENIRINIHWKNKNVGKVVEWLKSNVMA